MIQYHAHVYFEISDLSLVNNLILIFKDSKYFSFLKIHERKIGPHPLPMVELHFKKELKNEVMAFLNKTLDLEKFSALIHEDTGDDYKDHTEGATWIGSKLVLDFGFFDLIKRKPNLKIHK